MDLQPGYVIRYLPSGILAPQLGTVHKRITARTVELCCGTYVRESEVLAVVRHAQGSMPTLNAIHLAALRGTDW